MFSFRSGLQLLFYSGPPKEFVKTVLSSNTTEPNTFQQLYGKQTFESDYVLIHRMLYTTPSDITLTTQRKDAVGNLMMLTVKAIATPTADTGMFSIHTQDFKGFQYGNPQSKPKRVLVDLFADDACLEFTFFGRDKKPLVNVSQADINRVVQTAHRTRFAARPEALSDARRVTSQK